MDRNEQFRRRLEDKLNQPIKKVKTVAAPDFDAKPFIDIIMEEMEGIKNADEMTDFLKDIYTNPDLTFIFGESSVLNISQKAKVFQGFTHLLLLLKDFNSEPYVKELADLWNESGFEQFSIVDKDGEKKLNLDPYFEKHNLIKEQKRIVLDEFYALQKQETQKNRRTILVPALIALLTFAIPPFFIPNFLQRCGWLSPNAGWLSKIGIGLVSAVVLYLIAKNLFEKIADYLLKKNFNSQT